MSKSVPIGGREQRTGIGRHDGEQMALADKKKETAKAVSFLVAIEVSAWRTEVRDERPSDRTTSSRKPENP